MNRARNSELFNEIAVLISEFCDVPKNKISPESNLLEHLGIAGDDGLELLEAIDNRYSIDWNDIHLGIHFGSEGLGFPFPWQLKNDGSIYETQPCTVQDLINAIDSARWKGTPRILRPPLVRATMYALSTLQFVTLSGIVVLALIFVVLKLGN